ncbi:MAG: hypothetical protein WBC40_09710 [Halobacteriota archaeon]
MDRFVDHRVEGLILKPECSIPVIIGKIGLRLVDEEHQTEKIDVHAYLALTDEIPLILACRVVGQSPTCEGILLWRNLLTGEIVAQNK